MSGLYERLLKWNPWNEEKERIKELTGYKREVTDKIEGKSIALVGARRVGKTTILYQLIEKALNKGEKPLLIPFQDPAFSNKSIGDILKDYLRNSGEKPTSIFIDEVQLSRGWQQYIRAEYDIGERNIVVAGSVATLLKGKEARHLVGRIKEVKVFPLNFCEYLGTKGKKIPRNEEDVYATEKEFWNYLEYGGFPSVVFGKEKMEELMELKNHLVILDIIERYGFEREKFMLVFDYLVSSVGRELSYSSIERRTGISRETVQTYIEKLKEHFLVMEVPYYSRSVAVRKTMPKKYYLIDGGFISLESLTPQKGKQLENYIAVQLYKQGLNLYYYKKNGNEVDIVTEIGGKKIAINISADLSIEREKKINEYAKLLGFSVLNFGFGGGITPWRVESGLKTLLSGFSNISS